MSFYIVILLFILGAALGSFAGASVWRIRARQLEYDKKIGADYSKSEFKKLQKLLSRNITKDRSRCLNCGHELSPKDLIPVISWLSLKGRCRHCSKPIGYFEFVIESSLALVFVFSYIFWPFNLTGGLDIFMFALWLVVCLVLAIMFAYDAKWFLLPDSLLNALIIIGLFWSLYSFSASGYSLDALYSIFGSVAILSGLYLAIYIASKGNWIGFGDVKLGLGLALILADWKMAFMALFAANLIGTIIVLPGIISGKMKRMQHIPFGPLLIAGFVIIFLFGDKILSMVPYSL